MLRALILSIDRRELDVVNSTYRSRRTTRKYCRQTTLSIIKYCDVGADHDII